MINKLSASAKLQFSLLALLGFLIYSNTLGHDFVLDDQAVIVKNNSVQKGLSAIGEIWSNSYLFGYTGTTDESYRPVSLTVYATLKSFGGESPLPFHLFQVLSYTLLLIVLLAYLKRLINNGPSLLPFGIVLLFATHPIHTEVIANIKSLDEILALLFGTTSLLLFLKFSDEKNSGYALAGSLALILSFLSKETGVTFVPFVALQFWLFRDQKTNTLLLPVFIPLVLLFGYLGLRHLIIADAVSSDSFVLDTANNFLLAATSTGEYLASAFEVLLHYLRVLFVPVGLSYDYSYSAFHIVGLSDPIALLSIAVYLLTAIATVYGIIKRKRWSFGLAFFLATLSISSNLIVTIASSAGERFLFSPSLGLLIFLGLVLTEEAKKLMPQSMLVGLTGVIAIIFSFMTVNRNQVWENDETLYLTDVETVPNSFRAQLFAASVYRDKADGSNSINQQVNWLNKGIKHLLEAYKIYPEHEDTYLQLAQNYRSLGESEKMKKVTLAGLKKFNNNNELTFLLGEAYMNNEEFAESRVQFNQLIALKDSSHYYTSHYNMAATYLNERIMDSAVFWFNRCLSINPKEVAPNYYLGMAYLELDSMDLSIQSFSKIPTDSDVYAHSQSSIGTIYLLRENFEQALKHLKAALVYVPGDENILNNMAVAYSELGMPEKAEECIAQINSQQAVPGLQ